MQPYSPPVSISPPPCPLAPIAALSQRTVRCHARSPYSSPSPPPFPIPTKNKSRLQPPKSATLEPRMLSNPMYGSYALPCCCFAMQSLPYDLRPYDPLPHDLWPCSIQPYSIRLTLLPCALQHSALRPYALRTLLPLPYRVTQPNLIELMTACVRSSTSIFCRMLLT